MFILHVNTFFITHSVQCYDRVIAHVSYKKLVDIMRPERDSYLRIQL